MIRFILFIVNRIAEKKEVRLLFKIGEFSKLVRVSARMLRYYEKSGLLSPAETDHFTGYRMYSAAQIPMITRIVALRDMGFGVEEIVKILPSFDDAQAMQSALDLKSSEIRSSIADEESKLERIAAMRSKLKKESVNMIYEVELKSLKAEKVLSLREMIPSYDKEGLLWEKMGKFIEENEVACIGGGYSIYLDDEYKESDVFVEIAIPVREVKESKGNFVFKEFDEMPTAATVRFSGPYEGYGAAMERLATWVEQNGYVFDGLVRGLAITSPSDAESSKDYMTELQIAVRKV